MHFCPSLMLDLAASLLLTIVVELIAPRFLPRGYFKWITLQSWKCRISKEIKTGLCLRPWSLTQRLFLETKDMIYRQPPRRRRHTHSVFLAMWSIFTGACHCVWGGETKVNDGLKGKTSLPVVQFVATQRQLSRDMNGCTLSVFLCVCS